MVIPRALGRLAERVAALVGVDQAKVERVLLGAAAEPDAVKRIARALRHLRDEPLLCGLQPVVVCAPAAAKTSRKLGRAHGAGAAGAVA